jgi:DNA-binding transcriptional LysR family regulator
MDWRDLRIALAVDRHRTLGEAGRALQLDPTTVSRRVTALEEALGTALFVRAPEGWRATDAGRRVVDHAARMAQEVRALAHEVDAAFERVSGTVRVTTMDYVASWFLAPRFAELCARHPDLVVDLRCTDQVLDLAAGQADIALRLARPTEPGMRIRRLARVALGVYGARGYVAANGLDPLPADARPDLVLLGPDNLGIPESRWLRARFPLGRPAVLTTSFTTAFELVVRGAGLGVLAVPAAEAHPDLVRIPAAGAALERSLWRVVPEGLADAPRIRAVLDWLDAAVGGATDGEANTAS